MITLGKLSAYLKIFPDQSDQTVVHWNLSFLIALSQYFQTPFSKVEVLYTQTNQLTKSHTGGIKHLYQESISQSTKIIFIV